MDQTVLKEKKIAVVGIGGVGGYLAGMLGRAFPHLTLAARGKRRESLLEKGLVLHSDYHGEINVKAEHVVPVGEMETQDYIFVCVKNYSLEEVCKDMKGAVGEHTVLIPVMNGADPGERLRALTDKGTVVDSLIYIVAFANEDYSITQQGGFASLRIGINQASEEEKAIVEDVSAILREADIDHVAAEDIEYEIWRKYILNCAYNVESAYYDNAIGQLRADPVKAKEYEDLVREAWEVALAKGVKVTKEHVDAIIHRFYFELADGATSSLQRDLRDGKKTTEMETFSGYIVREAERYGLDVPVSKRMYEGLKKKIEG